jgi:phospholipid/cholesterol/gamma-HCH transport system substrate-binding protein
MTSLRSTLSAFDSAAVDSTVRNLRATSANLATLTADFQKTSTQLQVVLAKVDSGGGSAAMLLNDPGLYNDLRGATQRLNDLIADMKANPGRYLKFSIF